MARKTSKTKSRSKKGAAEAGDRRAPTPSARARQAGKLGRTASDVVRQAAAVLEDELAHGIVTARKVEQRAREERRVDSRDFEQIANRFRATGHELVNVAKERADELRSEETDALINNFLTDAHEVLDTVMDLVKVAPQLIDRLSPPEGESGGGK